MSLTTELQDLGFELVQSSKGAERFTARGGQYLVLWLQTFPDGTAEFTYELALGQYLKDKGFAVSVQDELSLMIFPRTDIRGPAEIEWVRQQIEAAETQLASVDLLAR